MIGSSVPSLIKSIRNPYPGIVSELITVYLGYTFIAVIPIVNFLFCWYIIMHVIHLIKND